MSVSPSSRAGRQRPVDSLTRITGYGTEAHRAETGSANDSTASSPASPTRPLAPPRSAPARANARRPADVAKILFVDPGTKARVIGKQRDLRARRRLEQRPRPHGAPSPARAAPIQP